MNSLTHWHVYLKVLVIGYVLVLVLCIYLYCFICLNKWTNLRKNIPLCPCHIQLSYIVVDLLIWWGIRSYINDFRKKKLKLAPVAYFSTYHGSISHLPTGYMWSPHVVPKPSGKQFCIYHVSFTRSSNVGEPLNL